MLATKKNVAINYSLRELYARPGFEEDEMVLMLLISEETEEVLRGLGELLTPSEFLMEKQCWHIKPFSIYWHFLSSAKNIDKPTWTFRTVFIPSISKNKFYTHFSRWVANMPLIEFQTYDYCLPLNFHPHSLPSTLPLADSWVLWGKVCLLFLDGSMRSMAHKLTDHDVSYDITK